MATEEYWAEPPLDRCHTRFWRLVSTLDAAIKRDDPVRFFDEVLALVDWSAWEARYPRRRGQPPIHPRYLVAAILYGLWRGIRSSRNLEEACCYRLDFIWLVQGRHIDHTTFSKFRTRFHDELKQLFKQVGLMAMQLGLIGLGEVAFDGTRVKANNSRFGTRTAKTLEEKLQVLDELFEHLTAQVKAGDEAEAGQGSPTQLPQQLADVEQRRQRLEQALQQARAADEGRRREGIDPQKHPAQVPMTDPDSRVMPNKEGGFAPNYTPVATTDSTSGFIVDCDVLAEVNESSSAVASVDRIEETFGKRPEKFLTDGGNNSGQIMYEMEERNVEFYAPVAPTQPQPGNPALRDDPTQPVPESEWPNLKRNGQGQLDKSCFIYVPEEDQFYCPQGKAMPFEKTKPDRRGGEVVTKRVYRSDGCAGCPLAAACLAPNSQHGRTITRDQYEEVRQRTAARMATASGRALYNQRPRIAETPFGILKLVMGMRQFLLRGLGKVKIEWLWAATAFNLMKLARAIGKLRAERTELAR
jgi:transposase